MIKQYGAKYKHIIRKIENLSIDFTNENAKKCIFLLEYNYLLGWISNKYNLNLYPNGFDEEIYKANQLALKYLKIEDTEDNLNDISEGVCNIIYQILFDKFDIHNKISDILNSS